MENLKLMNLEKELLLVSKHDDFAESPREFDEGSAWNIYTWTRNYHSIDSNPYGDVEEFLLEHFSESHVYHKLSNERGWNLNAIIASFKNKNIVVEPISKFEHGLVKYYRGAGYGWDDGVVGFAVLDKDKLKEFQMIERLTGKIINRQKEILDSELETYTDWCNGNAFYLELTDLQGNYIDSIGGFYGSGDDEKEILDIAQENFCIDTDDKNWKEYDEEIIDETFEVLMVRK